MQRLRMFVARPMLLVVGTLMLTACHAPAGGPVRVGTYDNRAIAIAWAASAHNPVGAKMEEHAAARAAGDDARVAELEAWGRALQRTLHFQGFGRVPVGDLLEPVQDGVATVAAERGLAAIAMHCDHAADGVTIVDVTDDLVALYAPDARTARSAREIRARAPMTLVELADLPAED